MVSLSLSLSLSLSFCENDTREPRDVREGEIREIRFILEIHICLLFIVLLPKVTVHDMFFNHAFSLPRGLFAELLSRKIAIAQINKIRAPPRRIHDGMPDGNSWDIKKERKKGVREREREREKGEKPEIKSDRDALRGHICSKKNISNDESNLIVYRFRGCAIGAHLIASHRRKRIRTIPL